MTGQHVQLERFTRNSDGSWVHDIDIPLAGNQRMSTIAPTSSGYTFLLTDDPAKLRHEVVVDATGMHELAPIAYSTLGVTAISTMSLTADDQRLELTGDKGAPLYSDRGSGGFRVAQPVPGVPATVGDTYMPRLLAGLLLRYRLGLLRVPALKACKRRSRDTSRGPASPQAYARLS